MSAKVELKDRLTIGIAGAGGDGVVALGSFLQKLAAAHGYFSHMSRYYGAQIRGGGSAAKLGLDGNRLSLPKDSLDVLICFSWEKYAEVSYELALAPETIVLCEEIPPKGHDWSGEIYLTPFTEVSREASGSSQNKNIVALGVLVRLLGLDDGKVRHIIEEDSELKLLKKNLSALEAGQQLFSDQGLPWMKLAAPKDTFPRVILHGNAAVARGALRAGCQAYFGYPITPASEIMQEMDNAFFQSEGVFLQTEDEIASAAMVLGASLTGMKSFTATSGPGIDLMTEVMGLAVASETPMVIVDVQRGGPSTGIPSKSEQSDLNHALYGGHGDMPRVVIAPMDIEGCYRLAMESIGIAQFYQTVVILLSDQWLAQTLVAVDDGFLKREYVGMDRKSPDPDDRENYRRYRFTDDFISPMPSVGDEGMTYQTSGLTHDEGGSPSFDFEIHQQLHEKRWRKLLPLCDRGDLVKLFGNSEASVGIVTWGSSGQVVVEAVREMGLETRLKICVPELICPMPNRLFELMESLERLLIVELNYSGQLFRYLRSWMDLPPDTARYSRAGGRVFSIRELSEVIRGMLG